MIVLKGLYAIPVSLSRANLFTLFRIKLAAIREIDVGENLMHLRNQKHKGGRLSAFAPYQIKYV
jgi:hypothetical protein